METDEQLQKKAKYQKLAKKYNLEALNNYNYENLDLDIDFGSMSEKEQKDAIDKGNQHDAEQKKA